MNDIQKGLELWIQLTGLSPDETHFHLGNLELRRINEDLKESLALDEPPYLTTLMLLDYYVGLYLDERNFSVNELLSKYDDVFAYLAQAKALYAILRSESLQAQMADFQSWLIDALKHYGVNNPAVFDMASSKGDLALLRRDAVRSFKYLQLHQFFQGEPETSYRPKYVTEVHEFWNINSLIKMAHSNSNLSGVSLNLLRDPVGTSSYFVFCIKNGGTLSILTDKPIQDHPLQKYMTRRPGKYMSQRIERHHFPYELLELDFDRRGDAYFSPRQTTEVVNYQETLFSLKQIKDLEPDEVIWTVIMFSLIEQKFWKENYHTEALTYTGEMVAHRDALPDSIQALVPASVEESYQRLNVPAVTLQDVSTDNMLDEWHVAPTQKNRWLEERYEHLVPDHVLNLIGNDSVVPLLTSDNKIEEMSVETYHKQKEREKWSHEKAVVGNKLVALDSCSFGSREEMISDQRWAARYNKAVIIKREAKREFAARRDEVLSSYHEMVRRNLPELLKAVATGELFAPVHKRSKVFGDERETVPTNILTVNLLKDRETYSRWKAKKFPEPNHCGPYLCYETGMQASLSGYFRPQTAEALALLCGCNLVDLPDVLQHWNLAEFYSGNSILERLDPMEWVVSDPWRKLDLNIEIFLSKTAYNGLRKDLGLPPNKFWLEEDREVHAE